MKNQHIFVDMDEASKVLMKFIGTEDYERVVSCIENNAKSGFLTGMSFAMTLVMGECRKFYAVEKDTPENDA